MTSGTPKLHLYKGRKVVVGLTASLSVTYGRKRWRIQYDIQIDLKCVYMELFHFADYAIAVGALP